MNKVLELQRGAKGRVGGELPGCVMLCNVSGAARSGRRMKMAREDYGGARAVFCLY